MSDWIDWYKSKGKCCVSGEPMADSEHLNIILLDKRAEWDYPVHTNVLMANSLKLASAVVHNRYMNDVTGQTLRPVKYAIEIQNGTDIIYHEVEKLQDA